MSENTDQNAEIPREIDLSRFEGHTPGPWREILDQGHEDFNGWDELQEMGFNDEARDLIAAAPDLLAAYKQKAQLADALWDFIEHFCPHLLHEATERWNSHSGEYRETED